MDNWINVETQEVPKEGEEVFVVFINEAGRHTGLATFKKYTFYYIAETDNGYFQEPYGIVTHWQPLPAPPNEQMPVK